MDYGLFVIQPSHGFAFKFLFIFIVLFMFLASEIKLKYMKL